MRHDDHEDVAMNTDDTTGTGDATDARAAGSGHHPDPGVPAHGASLRTVLAIGGAIARQRPGLFAVAVAAWTAWWALPLALGLGLQRLVDAIAAEAAVWSLAGLAAVVLAVEATRVLAFQGAIRSWIRWWIVAQTRLRANLLEAQLARGGGASGPPIRDAGAAVTVFRDDVEDTTAFVDAWIDLAGTAMFTLAALAIMANVDALVASVVAVPLVLTFAFTTVLGRRLRTYRRADREATERVTGLLGDVFGAVLTVKTAGAEPQAVARLADRNRVRRRTAIRDRLVTDLLRGASTSTVDLTIGLVLLAAAGAMRAGEFSVGDLALFASYATSLAGLPVFFGMLLARARHLQVAAVRMGRLLPGGEPRHAVHPRPERLERYTPAAPAPASAAPAPAAVTVRGLRASHPDGTEALHGIDLDLPAGSLTVVTGPVGAGKSTLLRALLGLVPARGEVRWDGEPVGDLAAHMVPPNAAYVAQVPRLFSESLRENLAVGRAVPPERLEQAVRVAQLGDDLAGMPDGLDTVVGSRGVRLSGGQAQRAAAARALAQSPSLLVVDDLSSALDVETEQALWQALRADRASTVLAVSHRAVATAHADQVVELYAGTRVG